MVKPKIGKRFSAQENSLRDTYFLEIRRVVAYPIATQIDLLGTQVVELHPSSVVPTGIHETIHVGHLNLVDEDFLLCCHLERGCEKEGKEYQNAGLTHTTREMSHSSLVAIFLPDILRLFRIVVNLFGHVLEIIHIEIGIRVVKHGLEADVVRLVGVHRATHEDAAEAHRIRTRRIS